MNDSDKVIIKEVLTKRDLRTFVNYPNVMYKDEPNFVPAFYGDDLADWDKKKNPAFAYCEARCFLAYKNGHVVGRIGAILSHKANEKWHTNRMRFSQVDFIDDEEVSSALFNTVEKWAKEKGCDAVHGPLGFCDLDREGMLVEGFDQFGMFITYYNYPYYNDHLKRLGYVKDTDWLEYKIFTPEEGSDTALLMHRVAERALEHKKLTVVNITSKKQYPSLIREFFELVNTAYAPLYGVVELNEEQIEKYAKKFAPLVNPDFACFIRNEEGKLIAFGVSAPSVAKAIKKSNGRLFPFGWAGVLHSLNKNDAVDMLLIAIHPDYQGVGVNAVILDRLIANGNKDGIKYAETGPQLETNAKILSQWRMFKKEQHKRRRCYLKTIS